MRALPRIITLLYHRVDEKDTDPWGICVSPRHFTEQLAVLKKYVPVITAEKAVQQVLSGNIYESCASITFDDGYEDNYTNALPILKQHNCPATFFIATAFTGSRIPFWWDELELICLHSQWLPQSLHVSVNDVVHDYDFETELTEEDWQAHLSWKWHEDAPTMRSKSFLCIWNLLRPLFYSEIEKHMNGIRTWANQNYRERLPMNEQKLQELSRETLSTIGLHTHTHPDLECQNEEAQMEDIEKGKEVLVRKYGVQSDLLAYPYGRYNKATLSVAEKTNVKACFTTAQTAIKYGSDIKLLGRYQVFDWDGQQFEEQLKKWLSE